MTLSGTKPETVACFPISNWIFNFFFFFAFFSEIGKGRLTVGKIYGGLLILENWKATKFGKVPISEAQVIGSDAITSRKYAL